MVLDTGEYTALMRVLTKNLSPHPLVRGFALMARGIGLLGLVLASSACGNKGDLYLDGGLFLLGTQPTIEDALDELEVFEAEEAVTSGTTGKVLENTLSDDEALLNGNKVEE